MKKVKENDNTPVIEAVWRAINGEREAGGKAEISKDKIVEALSRAIVSKNVQESLTLHDNIVKKHEILNKLTPFAIIQIVKNAIKKEYAKVGEDMYPRYALADSLVADGILIKLRHKIYSTNLASNDDAEI